MMSIVPTSLWLLGNLFHLFHSHDFNTYPQHNIRLNNHLRLDGWFMLLIGVAFLAFPTQIVGTIVCNSSFLFSVFWSKFVLHIYCEIYMNHNLAFYFNVTVLSVFNVVTANTVHDFFIYKSKCLDIFIVPSHNIS